MGFFSKIVGGGEARKVDVLGRPLACLVCGHDTFFERKAQMNSSTSSLLGIDWTDPEGQCVVCSRCGFIRFLIDRRAVRYRRRSS